MTHKSDLSSILKFIEGHRVLVLGGSGWLGRTAVRRLVVSGPESLFVTSTDGRNISVGRTSIGTHRFSRDLVREFDPTIVLNFAALTRDKTTSMGTAQFLRTNRVLFEQFIWASELAGVVMSIHLSSGAALRPDATDRELNPYGYLKRAEEEEVLRQASMRRRMLVARVWSVSGDLVTKPSIYAFSDLVLQGLIARTVTVRSPTEVWRRYTSADRYLSVALACCWNEFGVVLDSGGPRVEIRELARIIGDVTKSTVLFTEACGPPDDYASDGVEYKQACERLLLPEESLREQVIDVVQAFRSQMNLP